MIVLAVRWYLRFALSYRDVEELVAERRIDVDHATIYRRLQRFTLLLIDAARPRRHSPDDRWFCDETYVKVADRWTCLYPVDRRIRRGRRRVRLREAGLRRGPPALQPGGGPRPPPG